MTWKGRVTRGVVVVENGGALPEGAVVRIELACRSAKALRSLRATLLRHAGKGRRLAPDLAENHDHYIHGRPKRK
jgi:hypothetical protein